MGEWGVGWVGGDKGMGPVLTPEALKKQVADTDERDREQGAVAQGSREAGQQGDRRAGSRPPGEAEGRGPQRASAEHSTLYETGATRLVQSSVRGYPRSGEDCACRDQGQGAEAP